MLLPIGDEPNEQPDAAGELPSLATLADELAQATMIGEVNALESKYLDILGGGAAFFALLGVIGHGALRIFSKRKKGGN